MSKQKSKKFRIATEGATTDGRTIERTWLQDIADTYNPATYGARINLEHFHGIDPKGLFKSYGDVTAVEARENADGKLELFATIDPTADLVQLSHDRQKVYTSAEIQPNFAKTGKAYLVGLAVTDSPASLGTEVLKFAADNPEANPFSSRKHHPDNIITAAEAVTLEFSAADEKPSVLSRVRQLLTRKQHDDDARFGDVQQAIEEIAEHGAAQSEQTREALAKVDETAADHARQLQELTDTLTQMQKAMDTTTVRHSQRPESTGGDGRELTDC